MECSPCKTRLKSGMGGSHSGSGRSEHTEIMKHYSKKARRLEGKKFIDESLHYELEHYVDPWNECPNNHNQPYQE